MNIGTMPLANIQPKSNATTQSTQTNSKENNFGHIFNQITTIQNNSVSHIEEAALIEDAINLKELESLLNASSLEDVLDLLGVPHNEGLSLIGTGEEVVAVDEVMNSMNELLLILNIKPEELEQTMKELLEEENIEVNNIWDVIQSINDQASELMLFALNGEHHVTPKAAEKLLQVLKLAQVIGNNTDLLNEQQDQLIQLKEVLKFISNELTTSKDKFQTKSADRLLFANIIHGQMVQNSNGKKLVSNNEEKASLLQSNINSITNLGDILNTGSTNVTKISSFTLPAEKGAQGEALAKDIQNLINRSQISNTQGTMKLLVKLYPENLGSIRIEIFQKNGLLSARLLASTPQAKELLDSQIQQLKSTFAQQNIQMDRIDVAQSLQETDRNNRDQSQFNNLFKQQQSEKEEDEHENQDDEDAISFSEYLLNEEV
ncbi:flagellar hook-length control protein FliK [Lysinibacillus antri]|uniref:Flagellar hook-length control protein FliK n=1 Tax=Lysinibacillus antri TaxID=2498145 RepID=A0A3S0P5V7_9BACI|nr:flagellar hook-length control protein FliK [Lysinibacillus antri]RUL55803.1 flagellar hook-length control protein FliK [Lysinibacillus antri]